MTTGFQCTRCKFVKIGEKLVHCPACGAELVAIPESAALTPADVAVATPNDEVLGEGAKEPEKPKPYLTDEFLAIRAKRKAYIEKMQEQYGTAKTDWALPQEMRWEEARLLATLGWLAEQVAAAALKGSKQEDTLAFMKAMLAVQVKRQGGSISVREIEINKIHPKFDIKVIDHPEQKSLTTGQLLELKLVEPKEGIVVAQSIPKLNGR